MTENDLTTLRLAQTLPTAAVTQLAADSRGQKKRRNPRRQPHEHAGLAEKSMDPSACETAPETLDEDNDIPHIDYRV
jgi:hypothetical protein